MIRAAFLTLSLLMISACSQGVQTMTDRTLLPCGDKPNCVSTQDPRDEHNIEPFILTEQTNINAIEQAALELPEQNLLKRETIIYVSNARQR